MPLPHRNTIKFFGMGDKTDYLIWRQQEGTFTALDKKSLHVTVWSTVTGKIIKTEAQDKNEEFMNEGNAMQIALKDKFRSQFTSMLGAS